jgi:Family of unknown function (DUF6188)
VEQLLLSDKTVRKCLLNAALVAAERLDFSWAFRFGNGSSLTLESLWRLVSKEAIVLTSEDNGQKFGLDHIIDAASDLKTNLAGQRVVDVVVDSATSDLTLYFSNGLRLELLSTSCGFEAWNLSAGDIAIIGRNGNRILFSKTQNE